MKFAFFRRNEVLMALSHATVLGECPLQSGAKNAMLHARKLGRARFALPFRFGDTRALGLWTEIVQHGAELLAEETPVLRLLEEFGEFENAKWRAYLETGQVGSVARCRSAPVAREARSRSRSAGQRSEAEELVLRAVLRGGKTVDALCSATALPPEEVQHVVLVLTLTGQLAEDEQGLLRFRSSSGC